MVSSSVENTIVLVIKKANVHVIVAEHHYYLNASAHPGTTGKLQLMSVFTYHAVVGVNISR